MRRALQTEPSLRSDADCAAIYAVLCEQRVLKSKSDAIRRQLCRMVEYEVAAPGQKIIREGDTGNTFYMILTGTVDIFVSAVGRDAVTALQAGQDFGEQALQQKDARRNATCAARNRVELITLNRENYERSLKMGEAHKLMFQRLGYPNMDTEYIYTEVRLQGKRLGSEAGVLVAEALKTNPRVHTVDLGGNAMGALAGQSLGGALEVNANITTLNAVGNALGDEGAAAIGRALRGNDVLVRLNLHNNEIGDVGAFELAEALKTNKTLTTLDLSMNGLTDAGARYLAEALKDNRSLVHLAVRDNRISDSGMAVLRKMQDKNTFVVIDGSRPRRDWGFHVVAP